MVLTEPAIALLKEMLKSHNNPTWVFKGKKAGQTAIWAAPNRVRVASKVEFQPHDLRRTAASYMTGMGIARLTVSKILNHSEPGVTSVYDRHSYDKEKRAALEAWAQRLMDILENKPSKSNVVPITSAKN